mgnify:CR=1
MAVFLGPGEASIWVVVPGSPTAELLKIYAKVGQCGSEVGPALVNYLSPGSELAQAPGGCSYEHSGFQIVR